jgi:hypothetical protein
VSFSGTSNASGRTVRKQKVYYNSNIRIGYIFENALSIVANKILVDKRMLNEVREQIGEAEEKLPKTDHHDGKVFISKETDPGNFEMAVLDNMVNVER